MVVNYDVPIKSGEDGGYAGPGLDIYVHRIGRTGRFGKKGTAITLVDRRLRLQRQVLEGIEKHYGTKIEAVTGEESDLKTKTGDLSQ